MKNISNIQTFRIVEDQRKYALINYIDVINWYKLPFYKKWFVKKPYNEFIEI